MKYLTEAINAIEKYSGTKGEESMNINGYELRMTSSCCPEQYDVYKDGKQVAYLRLRNGWFYASVPDCCDNIVYEAKPKGDGLFDDDERMKYLTEAINAIEKYYYANPTLEIERE